MYLFRLSYYSRNTIPEQDGSLRGEIKKILKASRDNNPVDGITGALVFNNHYFAQVLEGDRKAVTQLFCKIANDPRHDALVMLGAHPIDRRLFADWSMAFTGQSVEIDTLYLKYGTGTAFNPTKMTAQALEDFIVELPNCDINVAHAPVVKA